MISQSLEEIHAQHKNFPQCVSNYDVAYCGLTCAPFQNSFIRVEPGTPVNVNITTSNSSILHSGTTYDKKYIRICQSFCQTWYDSCANATIGGIPLGSFYRLASEFCAVNAPLDGVFYEIASDNQNCFSGNIDVNDYSLAFAFGQGIESAEAGIYKMILINLILYVGKAASFKIQAVNTYNNPRTTGGDTFIVTIKNPSGVSTPLQVVDEKDGTYTVTYTQNIAQEYELDIRSSTGTPVINNPFITEVLPGLKK